MFVAGNPNPYVGTIDPSGRPVAIIGPSAGLGAEITSDSYALDLWSQTPETYISNVVLSRMSSGSTIRGAFSGDCQLWMHDATVTDGDPALDTGACDVVMHRSQITNYSNFGVFVDSDGSITAYDSVIRDGQGALEVEGSATFYRTEISNSYTAGGISLRGDLTLVNSLMYGHTYMNDGILAEAGGQFDILYSTIVGGIQCNGAGPSTIRNSIVLNHTSEPGQTCVSAQVDYSVVNTGEGQGMGNVVAGPTDLDSIFVDPATFNNADYHVLDGSIPSDVALWQDGDPATDFEGDARPNTDATADYAGWDVP